MRRVMHFLLLGILTIATTALAQQNSPCRAAVVTYSPFDERFAANLIIQPGPASRSALIVGDKQFTTQGTRWMAINEPDYMKPGPWATVVWIGDRNADHLLRVEFLNHASGGVNVRWLNEKLLYGSVWWGRIVSTDFVLDVEKQTFLYREMADYGELVQPCSQQ